MSICHSRLDRESRISQQNKIIILLSLQATRDNPPLVIASDSEAIFINQYKTKQMHKKLLFTIALLAFLVPNISQAKVNSKNPESFNNPSGWTKKSENNTVFEAKDSDGLDILVISQKPINLKITSIPEIILIDIKKDQGNTKLSIQNLIPNKLYYVYEDNLHNLTEMTSDKEGIIELKQDLKEDHLIIIKTRRSTKYINSYTGGDCSSIGIWDQGTLTCTLNQDVSETIQIDSYGVTLDGNGHTINPGIGNFGIYVYYGNNITVKNLNITNSSYGIYLHRSSYNTISNNTITNSSYGVISGENTGNAITGNTITGGAIGISINGDNSPTVTNNIAKENSAFDIMIGVYNESECSSITASNNIGSNDFPIGFYNSEVHLLDMTFSQLFLCNADSSTLNNITIKGSDTHKNNTLHSTYSNNVIFENIDSSDNYYGIMLYYSDGNKIINSKFNDNVIGMHLDNNSNTEISYATIDNSTYHGINNNSSNTTIHHTTVSNHDSDYGIVFSTENSQVFFSNFINNTNDICNLWLYSNSMGKNHYSKNISCTDVNTDGYCDYPYEVAISNPIITDTLPHKEPIDISFTYYAEIKNTPSGILTMRLEKNLLETSVIKELPNGWIVKVINPNEVEADGYMWLNISDPTDNSEGWMASKKISPEEIYLSYDSINQNRFITDSDIEITAEQRPAKIIEAVDHYYDNTDTTPSLYSSNDFEKDEEGNYIYRNYISRLKTVSFPKEIFYGILSEESGLIKDSLGNDNKFNNENVTSDYGHGITQTTLNITWNDDPRGRASRIKIPQCLLDGGLYLNCYTSPDPNNDYYRYYISPDGINIYKYYSNKLQSIYANIKDGMQILANKTYIEFIKNIEGSVLIDGTTYSESDRKNILTTWTYNGIDCDYVNRVAGRLDILNTYFPNMNISVSHLSDLIDKMHTVGQNAICTNLKSDYNTLTISNSSSTIGMIDGVEINTFPLAIYDTTNNSIGILSADLNDDYNYTVNGNTDDLYSLNITVKNGDESETFTAKDIPIKKSEKHIFKIDKKALKEGKNDAITIKVNNKTIKSGKSLTGSDFTGKIKEIEK